MSGTRTCPDCGTEMTRGFVPEFTGMGAIAPVWHPGEPKIKHDHVELDPSATIPINVFRCPDCGLLRRYALDE
jgi:hypothetical protein